MKKLDPSKKYAIRGFLTIIIVVVILVIGVLYVLQSEWFKRTVTDIKSNFQGGLERTINVYTADGNKLATYHGKIDIEARDGGVVKFDYDGKRYIYYNCFIETIADL